MTSCCGFGKMRKWTKVIVGSILLFNIITAVLILLVAIKKTSKSPRERRTMDQFLQKSYQETYEDLQSPTVQTLTEAGAVPSLEFLSLLKPVVHFDGLDSHQELIDSGHMSPVRNWDQKSERTQMYNGMKYEYGSILIPASGIYFVYGHVQLYVGERNKDNISCVFSHEISRYNALEKSEKVLLSNLLTEDKERNNDGTYIEYPSNVHGVVKLNTGDQLTVRVSDFKLLRHHNDSHLFGAYLV